jgi:hypothetical protein
VSIGAPFATAALLVIPALIMAANVARRAKSAI